MQLVAFFHMKSQSSNHFAPRVKIIEIVRIDEDNPNRSLVTRKCKIIIIEMKSPQR